MYKRNFANLCLQTSWVSLFPAGWVYRLDGFLCFHLGINVSCRMFLFPAGPPWILLSIPGPNWVFLHWTFGVLQVAGYPCKQLNSLVWTTNVCKCPFTLENLSPDFFFLCLRTEYRIDALLWQGNRFEPEDTLYMQIQYRVIVFPAVLPTVPWWTSHQPCSFTGVYSSDFSVTCVLFSAGLLFSA
jgi:hypothetical protein